MATLNLSLSVSRKLVGGETVVSGGYAIVQVVQTNGGTGVGGQGKINTLYLGPGSVVPSAYTSDFDGYTYQLINGVEFVNAQN